MHKLAVKLDGIERRKRTTGLLHLAAGFFLLLQSVDFYSLQQKSIKESVWPFFVAALLFIIYGILKKQWDPQARFNAWVRLTEVCVFTLFAINYSNLGKTFPAILLFAWAVACLLLMFTERKVFHDAEMLFHQDGIFIPGYFNNQRLFWDTISEVVIRSDYITIFKVNETFLQYEVLKKLDATLLNEIALYCKTQIHSRGKKNKEH